MAPAFFCSNLTILWVFSYFRHKKMFQSHLVLFLTQSQNQLFFQGAQGHFSGEWHLETKILDLGVFIATEVSLLLDPLQETLKTQCMFTYRHIHIHMHTYTYMHAFLYIQCFFQLLNKYFIFIEKLWIYLVQRVPIYSTSHIIYILHWYDVFITT